jgi:hypothetical protein
VQQFQMFKLYKHNEDYPIKRKNCDVLLGPFMYCFMHMNEFIPVKSMRYLQYSNCLTYTVYICLSMFVIMSKTRI